MPLRDTHQHAMDGRAATGAHESNLRLSADRAEAVADLLRAGEPMHKYANPQQFGNTKPSVGLRASDAKNRRIEILIS